MHHVCVSVYHTEGNGFTNEIGFLWHLYSQRSSYQWLCSSSLGFEQFAQAVRRGDVQRRLNSGVLSVLLGRPAQQLNTSRSMPIRFDLRCV